MYEIKDDYPSHEDLKLLNKLDDKGKYLLEDLIKVFSYRKPKPYKLYVERINYVPNEEEKVIMDLILVIQKYNQILSKNMEYYQEKKKENKYFKYLYEGMQYFNSDLCRKEATSSVNLLGNLISKYERKHISFDSKFLNRNIFNKSGLLPFTQKQTLEFFDFEIKKNGQNSLKSIKSIKFIERLYELIDKMTKRFTLSNIRMRIENEKIKNREKKAEYLAKLNAYKLHKKEIRHDMEEIENIKKLIKIANDNYERILNELNSKSKSKNKKKKVKIKTKNINKSKSKSKSKDKINETEENKDKAKEESINISKEKTMDIKRNYPNNNQNNSIKISQNEEKENENENEKKKKSFEFKKVSRLDRYNRTSSIETFKSLNLLNNRMTASTGFNDLNKTITKNNTFYNPNKSKLNNLNKIILNNNSTNQLQLQLKNLIRTKNNFFSNSDNNNLINIIDNQNKTTSHIFQHRSFGKIKTDFPNISNLQNFSTKNKNNLLHKVKSLKNFETKNININNIDHNIKGGKKNENNKSIKNFVKIKSNLKFKIKEKKEKNLDKGELYLIRKRKIPWIYEELKSYKNLLSIAKKNNSKSMRIEQLFSQLYDIKKIKNINGKKAPKELYNSYYNMKESIERCHAPETIFKKYKNNMDESLKKKIGKSNDQDDELKSKYFDFMQMIIKKKIEDDDNDL